MFRRDGRWDVGTWGAVICFLGWSRPVLEGLNALELTQTTLVLIIFAWIALVPGIFAYALQVRRRFESASLR
jgi:hypothetical protein